MKEKRFVGSLMLTLTAFIWGIAFVAQSVGMEYVGPYTFNAVRFLIGGMVLIPCIAFLKKQGAGGTAAVRMTAERRRMAVIGGLSCGLCLGVASTLQQLGILYSDSVGKVGFITSLYIILVPILGMFLGKKVGFNIWGSVAVAVVGMYLLCMKGGLSVQTGDVMVFISALIFSLHIMAIDYFSPRTDGVVISCVQFFVASAFSGVLMLIFETPTLAGLAAAWAPVLYAGVLSCGVAYTLQVLAQKNIEPTVASLIMSLESVFSLLAGWVILNQKLSGQELFGCVLVFAAIVLAQLPVRERVPDIQCQDKAV